MNKKSKKILFKEFMERRLMKKSLKEYKQLLRYFKIDKEEEEKLRQINLEIDKLFYINMIKGTNKKIITTEEEKKELLEKVEQYRKEYDKMYGTKCEFIILEEVKND
jgi:hypothetical protein